MKPEPSYLIPSRASRVLYVGLGLFFVALGAVGAVLPVIPTTGPLLVALWCFSKGSARLHRWLYFHPKLGPPLQRWREERIIPRRVKVTAYGSMGASFTVLCWVGSSPLVLALTAAFMLIGVVFIASRPSISSAESRRDAPRESFIDH